MVFTVRVRPDGEAALDAVTRAVIRSRAKLAYETVRVEDLPDGFTQIAERIELAEAARGARGSILPNSRWSADPMAGSGCNSARYYLLKPAMRHFHWPAT